MSTKLALAAVSYYGIDAGLPVRTDINTAEDGILYLTLSIPIKDADLGPIVKRMSGIEQKKEFEPVFTADISDEELRQDYASLQPALKSRFGSFGRYKAWRMENKQPSPAQFEADGLAGTWQESTKTMKLGDPITPTSEGVGCRKVQHVDAPEEEESELPAAVWVPDAEGEHYPVAMASDSRWNADAGQWEHLIQVALLTPEQKAKYGVQS